MGEVYRARDTRPLVTDPRRQGLARISPNGRWLIYQSTQTGRFEVFLATFSQGGARIQISTEGGQLPEWGQNGQEILFSAERAAALVIRSQCSGPPEPISSLP
jgi:eukaryotic-like serine/threonine-protein kinase